jgi:hypothetical protein
MSTTGDLWLKALSKRKPPMAIAFAMANKIARIVWAAWARGTNFRRPATMAS